MIKLNLREIAAMRIFLLFAKRLERDKWNDNIWRWDIHETGDRTVKMSSTYLGLVEKGLVEVTRWTMDVESLRATALGKKFICRATGCVGGDLYVQDSKTGLDIQSGKCPLCKGHGVVNELKDIR